MPFNTLDRDGTPQTIQINDDLAKNVGAANGVTLRTVKSSDSPDAVSLVAILAKLSADPATNTTLTAILTIQQAFAADTTPVNVSSRFFSEPAVASMTRQGNVTPYSINDAVSNNATPGSVVAFRFPVTELPDLPIDIRNMHVTTNDTGPGAASALFRAWIFNSDPALSTGIAGGDNLAFSVKRAGWIGCMEGTMRAFADGSAVLLVPVVIPSSTIVTPAEIIALPKIAGVDVWALLQTLTAWTPSATGTIFNADLSGFQGRA